MNQNLLVLNRRRTITLLGGAAASLLGRTAISATAFTCVTSPQATEGPYWVDEMLNRSDIRVDPADGSVRQGIPLSLAITVHQVAGSACSLLSGAHVDIWHCDASGLYSGEAANNTVGKKYLRGYQITGDDGAVQFTTIYPGWYSGRTVHIHARVRTYSGAQVYDEFTSQFFFDDTITDQAFTQAPYSQRRARDTRNASDMVLQGMSNGSQMFLDLAKTDAGYAASIEIGVNLKTVAAAKPTISANGVVNAAGFQAGVAPATWTTIFGQNLAASSRGLTASDIVGGNLPTTLGGVSVDIDNKPAYMYYVSPTQINVQAPANGNTGAVAVTVKNGTGSSDPATTMAQPLLPALFALQGYVAAVRSDGVIVTGRATTASGTVVAAKPGDLLEIFGNGFGPTEPAVAPGAVVQTAAPLTNPVSITIGGVPADVSFAGLSSTGLYQFNVTVPALADGDYPVIAQIAGLSTQAGVLLKIKN